MDVECLSKMSKLSHPKIDPMCEEVGANRNNPGRPELPEKLWNMLHGRLWHATGLRGLEAIMEEGQIKIRKEWRNSLCHDLGCVCLFDFGSSFVNTSEKYEKWRGWFGCQQQSAVAVWLEIDRFIAGDNILDAGEIRQEFFKNLGKQVIPGVEAGHKDPIPITSLKAALLVCRDDLEIFEQHREVGKGLVQKAKTFEICRCWSKCQDPSKRGIREFRRRISQHRKKL